MSIFLETKRLILKAPELSDLDNLIALHTDSEVMKYFGKGTVQTIDEVKRFLDLTIPYQKKYGFGFCSVFEKGSGNFVGQAGVLHLELDDTQPEIEVAYRLHKKFWGKGYATELTKALINWGFHHLSVERLVALIHPDNTRSRRALEKAGMTYTGKVKYRNEEEPCYEIYKSDAIQLESYDEKWPKMAALEINKLQQHLPKNHILDIQHVGSTAISGIQAKPIIDIQIAVDSLIAIKQNAIDALKTLGYEYWYENPDPTRMFFVKGMPPFGEKRSHHVHIVEPGSKHWQEKILFRDYLLSHPEDAFKYEEVGKKCVLENQIMGFWIGYIEPLADFNRLFIKEVLVHPKLQNHGIGKQLMKSVDEYARLEKCKNISLLTSRGTNAYFFYKKLGYESHKELVFMEKEII